MFVFRMSKKLTFVLVLSMLFIELNFVLIFIAKLCLVVIITIICVAILSPFWLTLLVCLCMTFFIRISNMVELMYGCSVYALSDTPENAFAEKCRLIFERGVRYPEALKVYVDGKQWVLDYLPNQKQASRHLASWLLGEGSSIAFTGGYDAKSLHRSAR